MAKGKPRHSESDLPEETLKPEAKPKPGDDDSVAPLEAFFEAVDADQRTLMRQLIWEVPYENFRNEFPKRGCSMFARYLKLAVADEWWEVEDETIARHLGTLPEYLDGNRKTEEYLWLREEVRRGMDTIEKQETAEDLLQSPRFQTRVIRETAQLLTQSKVPWIRAKMGEALMDRMAPKLTKAKEGAQPQILVLDGPMAKELADALHESMRVQEKQIESTEVHSGPLAIAEKAGE